MVQDVLEYEALIDLLISITAKAGKKLSGAKRDDSKATRLMYQKVKHQFAGRKEKLMSIEWMRGLPMR